jgi:hypothetical protein
VGELVSGPCLGEAAVAKPSAARHESLKDQ